MQVSQYNKYTIHSSNFHTNSYNINILICLFTLGDLNYRITFDPTTPADLMESPQDTINRTLSKPIDLNSPSSPQLSLLSPSSSLVSTPKIEEKEFKSNGNDIKNIEVDSYQNRCRNVFSNDDTLSVTSSSYAQTGTSTPTVGTRNSGKKYGRSESVGDAESKLSMSTTTKLMNEIREGLNEDKAIISAMENDSRVSQKRRYTEPVLGSCDPMVNDLKDKDNDQVIETLLRSSTDEKESVSDSTTYMHSSSVVSAAAYYRGDALDSSDIALALDDALDSEEEKDSVMESSSQASPTTFKPGLSIVTV